jgi:hypothetical protein
MLIKQADDQASVLAELEARIQEGGPRAKYAMTDLRNRRAGIRGEQQAAYLIDFDYAKSPNWAVIHDLRLEHGGRTAQIDHLLINRWMDIYVLETKSFHAGLKITDDGEFVRWNDFKNRYEGMASPIEQNERHIQVLKDVVGCIDLPTRLGLRITPTFQSFVLIDPSANVIRSKRFDTSRVIKADQLKKSIWRDIDGDGVLTMIKTAAKIVSGETVAFVAQQLAALHQPFLHNSASEVSHAVAANNSQEASSLPSTQGNGIEPTLHSSADQPGGAAFRARATPASPSPQGNTSPSPAAPTCKKCQANKGSILYGKYGYYFQCQNCNTNTSVRFTCQPGHGPKLRKERDEFYCECPECGTSDLFHTNSSSVET